ncbi:hypothetical protein BGZ60DRAFT_177991 [Tricladium varicosporioides]|nr:hypothetical protein BGZ60DRAFT_177991 [Hymenoscyphus varicosporioides]
MCLFALYLLFYIHYNLSSIVQIEILFHLFYLLYGRSTYSNSVSIKSIEVSPSYYNNLYL